jgi:MFS family permease
MFVLIPVFASRPMTSLFASQLEASMFEIGFLTVCYSILPLLFAVTTGRLTDLFGAKMPIKIGSIGIAFSMFLPFVNPSLLTLYIAQMILGISQLLSLVAIQNAISGSSSSKERDRVISKFSLFASIGMLLGPVIGGYTTEHLGFQMSFLFLSLLSLIPFVISLFISEEKKLVNRSEGQQMGLKKQIILTKELLTIPSLGRAIFISMLILSTLEIFYVYFPIYFSSIGMSSSEIGWLLTIQASAGAIIRLFIPFLVERYGRTSVLWVFLSIGAIAYGLLPTFNHFSLIVLASAIFGMGLGIGQPLTIVLTYNAAPKGRTGEALGTRLAGNRLAQIIFSLVFAGVSQFTGLGVIFTIQAILLFAGSLLAKGIKSSS